MNEIINRQTGQYYICSIVAYDPTFNQFNKHETFKATVC